MKKILITGANSYIGCSFEAYVREHYAQELKIDTVDMIDGTWREKDFSGYDAVFHVAGLAHQKETTSNAELYYKVNRDLAIETAQKAKAEGVAQFIILSSMSVYGMNCGMISKDAVPKPTTNYGKSKYQADIEISKLQSAEFKVCILRPPMVYGKGCKGNYSILRKLAISVPVFPKVKNERSMIYITNLVAFVVELIVENKEGLFIPQNSEYVCTSEMVLEIAKAHGKRSMLIPGFNWAISLFNKCHVKLTEKVFGSLTYEKIDLCNQIDFKKSIQETEQEDE